MKMFNKIWASAGDFNTECLCESAHMHQSTHCSHTDVDIEKASDRNLDL